ncbi:unnamed protein product [Enterobius vermicularis]|uniref:Retrotrans_gag domain-containing protein n=1 Tax=Enterobius vermicularis TaxID=51028 RepID=A0A0N4VR71_ENTVE|nr:unnamed protein product [Enterobius vermicularis]
MSLYEETVTRPQELIDQLALAKEVITNITLDIRQIEENLELYQSATESKTSCASTMHYNPPPAIPKFTGTVKTWTSFWNAFEAYIDENPNMREIQKLAYLLQSLEREAKNLVGGYYIIPSNYALVKDVLKRKYDRPNRLVKELYGELIALKTVDNRGLPKFATEVERIFQQLEGANQPVEVGIYERIIEFKLPYQTLLRLAERKRTKTD